MRSPIISTLFAVSASLTVVSAQFPVPVPWEITSISVQNIRHGTGGFWSFNITDTPTASPQGFETQQCYYYGASAAYFAVTDYPVDAPCNADFPELTFTFAPSSRGFDFNITHVWGSGDDDKCGYDNGTWVFSHDDILGQQSDVGNNFGQAGSFEGNFIAMYPSRSAVSTESWP